MPFVRRKIVSFACENRVCSCHSCKEKSYKEESCKEKLYIPLAEIVSFVPFVRRKIVSFACENRAVRAIRAKKNRDFRLQKSCLFVPFVRRKIVSSACGNRVYSCHSCVEKSCLPLAEIVFIRAIRAELNFSLADSADTQITDTFPQMQLRYFRFRRFPRICGILRPERSSA